MTTLRGVLSDALAEVDADRTWSDDDIRDLALSVQGRLHDAGLAIHDSGRCVRPKGPLPREIGRPWEEVMGSLPSSE